MSCKMCNTQKSRCPAFDGEWEVKDEGGES